MGSAELGKCGGRGGPELGRGERYSECPRGGGHSLFFNGGVYIHARLPIHKGVHYIGSGALELGDAEYVLRTRRFRTGVCESRN